MNLPLLFDRLRSNWLWLLAVGLFLYALRPRPSGPEVGSRPESVQLQTLDGVLERLEPQGKPLLVEAFASWCVACRRSSSTLTAIDSLGKKHALDVVAVSVDSDVEKARGAAESWPIRARVMHDPSGDFSRQFSIQVLPTYILIAADGTVQSVHAGVADATTFRTWLQAAEGTPP
jgi:cytochrome c biogenesis protein CcmG, thiol:disulfide interchange protein DsbE